MFGSNVNYEQDSQDNVHESRTHNENNITCDFPSDYTTQSTTLTNYCLCTCCHKTDILRSQCIIFKESKNNFGNTVVVEALSNRFSIPTSKVYICKKCDKDLLGEKMQTNSVASLTRLTSNKPQQKCIHCNSVPTDKSLTFDKTKYGQNTIVSQMKQNDELNIICNKWHNAIFRDSLVMCLTCRKIMKKMCTFKFDMNKYSSQQNQILEMPKPQKTKSYICKSCQPKFTCVCCNTDMHKYACKMHNKVDYDFTNFVVSQYLGPCIKFCT